MNRIINQWRPLAWNVDYVLEQGTSVYFLAQRDYGLLLLGISEIRFPNAKGFSASNEPTFIISGWASGQKREGGIYNLQGGLSYTLRIEAYTDLIISARFLTSVRNLTVIQCYASTEVSELGQNDKFYDSLTGELSSVNRRDIVTLKWL